MDRWSCLPTENRTRRNIVYLASRMLRQATICTPWKKCLCGVSAMPNGVMPDLIMIDGGRPQIDHIAGVFRKYHIAIPLVGISKYGGDALVFPGATKQTIRELAHSCKPVLLRVRDEAHRFALRASRRKRDRRI